MKITFWSLLVAGFVACQVWGIGRTLERVGGDWASPWMIAGAVLGATIVALSIGFAIGFRPNGVTDLGYVLALVALIGVKVLVSLAGGVLSGTARG